MTILNVLLHSVTCALYQLNQSLPQLKLVYTLAKIALSLWVLKTRKNINLAHFFELV